MCEQIQKTDVNTIGEYYVIFISNKNNSVRKIILYILLNAK